MYFDDEVKLISEGIAILILVIIGFSLEKTLQANDWLGSMPAKTKRAVILYIVGLIILKKEASCTKISSKLGKISHDQLTRMLSSGKYVIGKLSSVFINFCLAQTSGGWLIIDDSLIPKIYSHMIEGVYYDFDHAEKKFFKGMRIVMIIWTDGNIRIPLAWEIWHKEKKILIGKTKKGKPKYQKTGQCLYCPNGEPLAYRAKNDIALELLEDLLKKGISADYLAFDSWYASKKHLSKFLNIQPNKQLHCYSRLKSNRYVVYQGQRIQLTSLSKQFLSYTFDHKHDAYIKAIEVYLPGFGNIKLLFVRKDKHPEKDATKYLFSTDLSASAPKILLRYRSRWTIECMFRDLKQHFNIGYSQARSLSAQENHISLSLLAFVILELVPDLQFQDVSSKTIEQKKNFFLL